MQIGNLKLEWLGHSGFFIQSSKNIYIDPYNISENSEKADLILITHSHYDHCSIADIQKIIKNGTKVVLTADSQSKITRLNFKTDLQIVEPDKELSLGEIKISTLPSYNLSNSAHPKEEGWVGFLIKMENVLIYHAGDSDFIPEMQKLTGYSKPAKKLIALLPVGGKFTMNPEEAFEAAKLIKPFLAIPMHYGSVIGDKKDAEEFVELCMKEGINAQILEKV